MILFADTSALIKLYIDEAGSDAMAVRARDTHLAVSALAYAEVHAAFARRHRESLLDDAERATVVDSFEQDWREMILTPLGPDLLAIIPGLVHAHPLRGADAVHLASALAIRAAGMDVVFAAADARLLRAAEAEDLAVFEP